MKILDHLYFIKHSGYIHISDFSINSTNFFSV